MHLSPAAACMRSFGTLEAPANRTASSYRSPDPSRSRHLVLFVYASHMHITTTPTIVVTPKQSGFRRQRATRRPPDVRSSSVSWTASIQFARQARTLQPNRGLPFRKGATHASRGMYLLALLQLPLQALEGRQNEQKVSRSLPAVCARPSYPAASSICAARPVVGPCLPQIARPRVAIPGPASSRSSLASRVPELPSSALPWSFEKLSILARPSPSLPPPRTRLANPDRPRNALCP
ncbi:hypothetical protein Q7P37_003984 [Cladosporium fusiforme]